MKVGKSTAARLSWIHLFQNGQKNLTLTPVESFNNYCRVCFSAIKIISTTKTYANLFPIDLKSNCNSIKILQIFAPFFRENLIKFSAKNCGSTKLNKEEEKTAIKIRIIWMSRSTRLNCHPNLPIQQSALGSRHSALSVSRYLPL